MTKIYFSVNDKPNFGTYQAQVSNELIKYLQKGLNFTVKFSLDDEAKTYPQLKAIHKLCSLYANRLTETQGYKFSLEMAKESIKYRFNFLRLANDVEAFKEALKIRNEKEGLGKKMTFTEFNFLVRKLQETLMLPRSFASATKEEMIELITNFEAMARDMGWHEIKIESKEMEELIKYYS